MRNVLTLLFVLFSMNLTAQPLPDIDKDDDGLIEVSNLETLNAMRYRLDGSGLKLSPIAEAITTGCAAGGCKGYELTRDLDFNDIASYQDLANMKLWTTDAGWQPIGTTEKPFIAIFKTNNSSTPNTIFNLTINRADESNVGLFGHIGSTAKISGIGLLDVKVEGNHQVGGLVGKSTGGQISNSYANGHVVGKGGEVGLLVGHSSGSITNSYANGEVSGEANGIGGLVGANHGKIANSYAMGSVVGSANNVGGLVGDNIQGTISNCYTTGSVSGGEDIGGLVGLSNLGTLISNYVSGKASGTRYIGGLVGSNIGGTITQSYWDKTASKLEGNTGGVGLLASELQSANAQDEDLKKPYYKWSTAHWDFGTAEQYPILKYATGSDLNNPVCGPEQTLPNCGVLLLGQHASLKHILFLSDANLSPNFKPTELNYQLGITPGTKTLQLIPIASNPNSTINISRNGTMIDSDLANGTTSSVITLGENTEIVIEVSAANQRPAQYSLTTHYLQEITILGIPDKAIDEGEFIMLDASQSLEMADTLMSYRWTQSKGKTLSPSPDREGAILWLHIPEDYVPATAEHANLGLTLEINDGKATIIKDITLTIAKVDNGNIPVAPPTLTILEGTAPEIDLDKDPDGSGKDFSYQWQSRAPGQDTEWIDINEATEKTHIISFLTESYTKYRVLISYTDGQGYKTIAASRAARYVPEIMILDSIKGLASEETIPADAKPQRTPAFVCSTTDIDQDDDGLIEICDLEGLNAIRYQLDGTGYTTSTGVDKITAGCKSGGCNGYELMKDLDFNDDASYSSTPNKVIWTKGAGWEPIRSYDSSNPPNSEPFKAIFEGNGHTISNLMINRPGTNDVGLFGYATGGIINNVGLLSVKIQGREYVGGLVGRNSSSDITNSYATGAVTSTRYNVGGLVGFNSGTITNSYTMGAVKGVRSVGGLAGFNSDTITNSYATGDAVEGKKRVGGLVGINWNTIRNSYATGSVKGHSRVGGLVGVNPGGTITNSYATGKVTGTEDDVGGLVGRNENGGTITNSYWNKETSGIASSAGGMSKTTTELKSAIAQQQNPNNPYYRWKTADWDFGTSNQYPILKYAKGPDENNLACREQGDTTKDLPVCGSLLPLVLRGLSELRLVKGNLSPNFIVARQNYVGTAVNTTNTIQFKPIAMNSAATISISVDEVTVGEDRLSGTTSSEIILKQNGITKIIISVKNGGTTSPIEYTLNLDYYKFEGKIDTDGNGLINIDTLEKLNAIRYQLDGTGYRGSEDAPKITIGCPGNKCKGYELTKNLDFDDEASYSSTPNKVIWTEGAGWEPIGDFTNRFKAIFEGNGHTISNLMIDKPNTDRVGLFGHIRRGTIMNVGLLSVKIEGDDYVGGLVGSSRDSDITNSYATGVVTGTRYNVGGLVGTITNGTITNSYATGAVTGTREYVGGLVGGNWGRITNSYATGSVKGDNRVGGLVGYSNGNITNSYAAGAVTGTRNDVGSLVGRNDSGGTITNSYWNTQTSGQPSSAGGIGKTTAELQSAIAQQENPNNTYYRWNTKDWDFGTSGQYPALNYAVGPDTDNPACGSLAGQPACETLLPGQGPLALLEQLAVSPGTLSPSSFDPKTYKYGVTVEYNVDSITLNTTATGATIHITSNTSGVEDNTTNTSSITIPLTIAGDTIITITVTEGEQRPTRYTITVRHNVPGNLAPPGIEVTDNQNNQLSGVEGAEPVDEGQQVTVNLEYSGNCTPVNCVLEFPGYPSLSLDVLDKRILQITIPDDFVESNKLTQKVAVVFAIRKNRDIASKETTFVVKKIDNGSISIGQPTLVGSQLTAPEIDLSSDPDKGVQKSSVRYQWWHGNNHIEGATAETYTLGDVTGGEGHYVQISYTDGQGHKVTINSEAIRGDIDVDDDGLIEIKYIDDLDVMRYVMDGSGYKRDMTAITSTVGCAEGGCKGYELIRDLDFQKGESYRNGKIRKNWTKDKGWQPIGDDSNSFSSTFKGNNHTISNLMINRNHSSLIGLFSMITKEAMIDGVNLYKVNIKGNNYVGALVGKNAGGIIMNSSVSGDNNTISTIEGTGQKVGGLVGINDNYIEFNPITVTVGKVINSFADAHVIGVIPDSGDNGSSVGGLIGLNKGIISNNYASGNVSGNKDIGGLVGRHEASEITNSYATSSVSGNDVGGLVGHYSGTVTHSYWDKTTSGIGTNTGGEGKTTTELQSPMTATGIYSSWSTDIWDFGSEEQYPALKKSDGTLLAGQRLGLQSLQISGNAVLIETFKNTKYEGYTVLASNDAENIDITPTAADPTAEITLITSGNNKVKTLVNKQSSEINLAPGDSTTITIVVETNTREVTYILEVVRAEVQITNSSRMPLSEGNMVDLNADTIISDTTILNNISLIEWEWMEIDRLLETTTTNKIEFPIPATYVDSNASIATVTFKVTGTFTIGGKTLESRAEVELTINKWDNGSLETENIGELILKDAKITAPDLDLALDIDGVNANPVIRYTWQKLSNNGWENVSTTETMINIYEVKENILDNTQYRVLISYTDGQGYRKTVTSNSISYVDIDRDNNGLIEIETREELGAIRHQLDGSGYKKSSTDTEIITEGCPIITVNDEQQRQCKGYELKAHIDLSGGGNWEPIGNANNPFNTIFNGNHYTISNLTIDNSNSDNVGFFGTTTRTAEIRNVGLLNVNITADGKNKVGGLVGFNKGTIEGSYVVSSGIRGGSHVGALVGATSGGVIKNNYATVKSLSENNSSVCELIGEINGGMIEGNQMIGPCENNKLFECPAP